MLSNGYGVSSLANELLLEKNKMNEWAANKPNIVIATNRDREHFENFLDDWETEFAGCHVIIVEDRPKAILKELLSKREGFTWEIHDWESIDGMLGKDSWIIPRKTCGIKSFGFWRAYENKALFIVTLDDDTMPPIEQAVIAGHYYNLFERPVTNNVEFYNTLKHLRPRGTLENDMNDRGCDVSHGGWLRNPDLDATEQAKNPDKEVRREDFNEGYIPQGVPYSMCGMNLAFFPHAELLQDMYFGLQGHLLEGGELVKLPVDRADDIFAGYVVARHKWITYTGAPFIIHDKASNLWTNLRKEDNLPLYLQQWYDYLYHDEPLPEEFYWNSLKKAYTVWRSLFEEAK